MRRINLGLLLIGLLILVLVAFLGVLITQDTGRTDGMPGTAAREIPGTSLPPGLETPGEDNPETPVRIQADTSCAGVLSLVRSVLPHAGFEFSSPGGASRSVALVGVLSGETGTGNGIDLAELLYLDKENQLRSLRFATGFSKGDLTYFPMNLPDPEDGPPWRTRTDALRLFSRSGKGVRLVLNGFLRADREIAWEDCAEWAYANPPGICDLGLELELASHGGDAAFLQSARAPEGWFAFGWSVEFTGEDIDIPEETGECDHE